MAEAEMKSQKSRWSGELKPENEKGMAAERILERDYTRDSCVVQSEHNRKRQKEQTLRLIAAGCRHPRTAHINRPVLRSPFRLRQILKIGMKSSNSPRCLTLLYPGGELCDAWGRRIKYKNRSCANIQEVKE